MDDETKDYSELNLEQKEENTDQTIELNKEELLTVDEQIKQIKEEDINDKIEEIKESQNNNKKLSKTLIILIIVLSLLLVGLLCYFIFFRKSNSNNETANITIVRPNEDLEYTMLKQNQVTFICDKTIKGEKITSLKKGLVIECNLTINTTENISELYFDINNSKNLKIKEVKNTTDYELINDKNTYLLKASAPFNQLSDEIKFYFEVIDISEQNGYAQINDIVFKDSNNNFYKMANTTITFPREYGDKIFIYKQTISKETTYLDSKISLDDNNLELIDTYKCIDEECEVKNNHKNYFIIFDKKLIIYDALQKIKQSIKGIDENFDHKSYEYEPVTNKDNNVIGILFKKNYKDNSNCNTDEEYCLESSISGYEISYYSLDKNMFTIALDYGFIGANIYTTYDKALLLSKDNKYGIFSYGEDRMILELSKKYNSIEYDSDLNLVKLGVYDKSNDEYYYNYYNLDTNSFKMNITNLKSINKTIYYIKDINKKDKTVYMLFNSKGQSLIDIPYLLNLDLEIIDNKTIAIKSDDNYDLYDLDGNYIETSHYVQSGLNILKSTSSYLLALNKDNSLIVTDKIGKTIVVLMPSNNVSDIYEIDTMNIVKCEEVNKNLEIIITNFNISEENKNAYKFNIDASSNVSFEYINYEQ